MKGLITLLLAVSLAGCVTPAKFKALESRVQNLESANQEALEKATKQEQRLENLNTLLKTAKLELMRSGADTAANLDELTDITRRNQGAVEETRFMVEKHAKLLDQLSALAEAKLGVTVSDQVSAEGETEGSLYDEAVANLGKAQYREARALFQQFLAKYPGAERAPDAQYYVGDTYRKEGDNEAAIQAFKQVYENHRESARMPEALLGIGDSLTDLGECDKAKKVYGLISRDAKDSPQVAVAKERLSELKGKCSK